MANRFYGFIHEAAPNGMRAGIILLVLLASFIIPFKLSYRTLPLIFLIIGGILGLLVCWRWPAAGLILLLLSGLFIHYRGPGGLNASLVFTLLLIILWVGRMVIIHQRFNITSSATFIPLAAMAFTISLSFVMGQIPWFPFVDGAPLDAQMGGYLVYLLSLGTFFISANLIKDLRWLKGLVWIFVLTGILYTIGIIHPGIGRLTNGLMVDLRGLFWIWLIALIYSQVLFNKDLNLGWRIILFTIIIAILYILFVLKFKSKSSWLPAFIVIFILTAFRSWRLAGLMLIAAIFTVSSILPDVLTTEDYSLATRLEAIPILLQILRANPVFGVGFANYYWYTPLFPIRGYYVSFSSHNNYIDIAVQTGILGLMMYTWLMVQISALALKLRKHATGGFEIAYVHGAIGGLVGMILVGFLGDWVLPFVYNIGLWGFRNSVQGWLFLGGLVALQQIVDTKLQKSSGKI